MSHLGDLDGKSIPMALTLDENGYLGRQCPDPACHGYFKVVPGTGLKGSDLPSTCPYCGRKGAQNEFFTQDQIEYAKSLMMQSVQEALNDDLRAMEFDTGPIGPFGIRASLKFDPWSAPPLHRYREKELETSFECPNCSLKYAVYGVFAYCPDCGQHNSLQILVRNLEIVSKELDLASTSDADLSGVLVANALEDCVSAFDGFGREVCRVYAAHLQKGNPRAENLSFQNLSAARLSVSDMFGIDFAATCSVEDWNAAVRSFQKRHIISHKSGIVDDEYIRKSGDHSTAIGHKSIVESTEVRQLANILAALGSNLAVSLAAGDHEDKP
jgi:hypothetical protein